MRGKSTQPGKLVKEKQSVMSLVASLPQKSAASVGRSGKARKQVTRQGSMYKQPAVYILASKKNGTLYIGVTSDLVKRIWEHKSDLVEGFTRRYGVHQLVWYELHDTMESAILREKRLKEWKRAWKMRLIEESNPEWQDLYDSLV